MEIKPGDAPHQLPLQDRVPPFWAQHASFGIKIYDCNIADNDLSKPIGNQGILKRFSKTFLDFPLQADLVPILPTGFSEGCTSILASRRLVLERIGRSKRQINKLGLH